jgi:F420H(2)-dependent quinone reductase
LRIGASGNKLRSTMGTTGLILRLHERLYKRTGGRVGHRMIGVPTLLLGTVGRRSGATRTNALVYARDGDDYLLVASNGGADRPPAWLHNLRANPKVEIQIAREHRNGVARVIESTDPDHERAWRIVNDNNHDRYTAYQKQTARAIPVIAVTPTAPAADPESRAGAARSVEIPRAPRQSTDDG